MKLWKSYKAGFKNEHGNIKWELNKWFHEEGKIEKCKNGFHASVLPLDAMRFVDCEIIARVSVKGESDFEDDKQAWSDMKIDKAYYWRKEDSVALSIYAAELCINNFEKEFPDDDRPRKAIEAAKAWLENPTKKNQDAAWSAESAGYAAWSAAESAESAGSAAWSAAGSAAWSAAWSAESARSAARSAAWSAAGSAAWSAESARSAARSAAWSAAGSAEYAAWSAESARSAAEYAEYAAWSAWSAAGSAKYAAWSAAWSAAYDKTWKQLNKWVEKRIKTLEEIKNV